MAPPDAPNYHRAIAARMRKVLDTGRVENASVWSTAAGLNRTYVTAFIDRVQKGVTNDIGANTLAALASVARVNPAWLAYGYGPVTDTPANLKRLIARGPKDTYPEEIILQAIKVLELIDEPDMPEDVWRDYLDGLRKEARRAGLGVAAAKFDKKHTKP